MADDNLITRESLRTAAVVAWQDGGNLQCAGFALQTIADLLGADGCEHYLTEKEKRGLCTQCTP